MSTSLPALYTAAQTRALDRCAIERHGIPGIVLMKRAGTAAYAELRRRWPAARAITVLCGSGNNGGDGYIVAALARQQGLDSRVLYLAEPATLTGDAARAWQFARDAAVPMAPWSTREELAGEVLVDALLGTGLTRPVAGDHAAAIAALNAAAAPVLAIDIPSGLDADTGAVLGIAVRAAATVTFIGRKLGLYTGRGPACTGAVAFASLEVPDDIYRTVLPAAECLALGKLRSTLPPRERDAHKGRFGHVLVIGGDRGFGGAALMAAEAAARSGAGLVSVATHPTHAAAFLTRRPELMVKAVPSGQELEPLLAVPSVLVVGPGLGRSPWSEQMLQQAFGTALPMVLDADALNLLASGRFGTEFSERRWVLTPHPGEAARLLGLDNAQVQADRPEACRRLQQRFGGAVLLKGAGTLIAGPDGPLGVCPYGNPGMASGGMGDVLAGIIGALLAQGLEPAAAARLGACLHGRAADLAAAARGEVGLLASDLPDLVRELLNGRHVVPSHAMQS
ncbi:MAG: bifunctional NAD(P)H-hydrate repair enzyme Nnr [Porticoccaceae bacterium]